MALITVNLFKKKDVEGSSFCDFFKRFPFDDEKLNSNYFESHNRGLKCLIHKSGKLNY